MENSLTLVKKLKWPLKEFTVRVGQVITSFASGQ